MVGAFPNLFLILAVTVIQTWTTTGQEMSQVIPAAAVNTTESTQLNTTNATSPPEQYKSISFSNTINGSLDTPTTTTTSPITILGRLDAVSSTLIPTNESLYPTTRPTTSPIKIFGRLTADSSTSTPTNDLLVITTLSTLRPIFGRLNGVSSTPTSVTRRATPGFSRVPTNDSTPIPIFGRLAAVSSTPSPTQATQRNYPAHDEGTPPTADPNSAYQDDDTTTHPDHPTIAWTPAPPTPAPTAGNGEVKLMGKFISYTNLMVILVCSFFIIVFGMYFCIWCNARKRRRPVKRTRVAVWHPDELHPYGLTSVRV